MQTYEFEVLSDLYGKTMCVIDLLRFVNGVRIFSCGDGTDYKIIQLQDIAKVKEYINNLHVKTMSGWKDNFDQYVSEGDIVEEKIVDYFINCLPPISMTARCSQCGEPYSHEKDSKTDKIRATYTTFTRIDDNKWMYCGYCFAGETYPRGI